MLVRVRRGDSLIVSTTIRRPPQRCRQDDESVAINWVGDEAHEVEGSLPDLPISGDVDPISTAVIRSIQTAFLVFDQQIDAVGINGRDCNAHLAERARRGKPRVASQLKPGEAAVGRLIHCRVRPAAPQAIRPAIHLPHCRVQCLRIVWVHCQVDRTCLFALKQHPVPCGTAVRRLVDAPFWCVLVGIAQHGGIDRVGIARVDPDARDNSALAQPHM